MLQLSRPEQNIVLVSGPAGSGKDTLIESALTDLGFEKIVTTTSRAKRATETEGKEYHFLSAQEFQNRIANNEFVEYSQNENGAYYGVEEKYLAEALSHGKKLIWKVDWKGVQTIKRLIPGIKAIGILTPLETLERRLRAREGQGYEETYFQERLAYAKNYITQQEDCDYTIWNEDGQLTKSLEKFKELLTHITSA